MVNVLTIDVEDYYMVSAFDDVVKIADWDQYSPRIEKYTQKLLDILEAHGTRGTFFVLGWVAEHYPHLVKEIASRGHEVGCHSNSHRMIYEMDAEEFARDTRRAKSIIEDVIGEEVWGYRAPSYSITRKSFWALEILADEGFRYDSSIFPIHHDRYGIPGFHRFPAVLDMGKGKRILEIPPSTYRIFGCNVPVAGGGYLRLYPLAATEYAIQRLNGSEGKPAVVYVHPWEIDPEQPKMRGRMVSRLRHYMNLEKTEPRLNALLNRFEFAPARDVFSELLSQLTTTKEVIECAYS